MVLVLRKMSHLVKKNNIFIGKKAENVLLQIHSKNVEFVLGKVQSAFLQTAEYMKKKIAA